MSGSFYLKAIPTKVGGHLFASRLEARMARILHGNKIEFEPHKKFQVFGRDGEKYFYTVDFYLKRPYKFAGIPWAVTAIEVKGILTKKDIHRCDALDYCHFCKTWIVTDSLLRMWELEGLFWSDLDRNRNHLKGGK